MPRMSLLAKEQGAMLTEAMLESALGRSACLARAARQYGASHRQPEDSLRVQEKQTTIEDGIAIFMVGIFNSIMYKVAL